jgi:hypothetical protein
MLRKQIFVAIGMTAAVVALAVLWLHLAALHSLTDVAVARAEVCGRTLNPCFIMPFRAKGATRGTSP